MTLGRVRAWTSALLVASVLVPAASEATRDVRPSRPAQYPALEWKTTYVEEVVVLEPGTFISTVTCPEGYKLFDGGVVPGGKGRLSVETFEKIVNFVSIVSEAWRDGRYAVWLANTGDESLEVLVRALCGQLVYAATGEPVKQPAPKVVEKTTALAPATRTELSTACPRGTFPVFGGYRTDGRVRADATLPSEHGWLWNLFWDQPPREGLSQQARTQAVCYPEQVTLPRKQARRGTAGAAPAQVRLRFSLATKTADVTAAGVTRVTATCKAGQVALGGGYAVVSGYVGLVATQAAKASYSALSYQETAPARPPKVTVTAVCAPVRIR